MIYETLRDFIDSSYDLGCRKSDKELEKRLDERVIKYFSIGNCHTDEEIQEYSNNNPFTQRYISCWVLLESGYAVGFNENPSFGWSFPIKSVRKTIYKYIQM